MAGKEGERPGQLTRLHQPDGQLRGNNGEGQAGNPLTPMMEQEVSEKLKLTPKGEDPAFWPVRVFNEIEYYILVKDDPTLGPVTRAIGEKYAPYKESIHRVKTAYSILAYLHIKYEGWKENIGANLELERQGLGQDQVELNDQELKILSQLTAAINLPFNHKKRVYSYSDVPILPWVNPYSKRHLTTEEIREGLSQTEDEKSR